MSLVPVSIEPKREPVLQGTRDGIPVLLWLILAAGALLRLYALAAESFYFDEAYSVWAAGHSAGWLIKVSTERIFPPLYYLLLHFWLPLGKSEFAVRLLSVVFGLVSILGIYAVAKQLFDTRVGLLSALLLAISPLHLWYSQEARMYMVLLTLGLCSVTFLLLSLREGRRWHWLAYVLSTALAMNTHYFTLFLAVFENVYALYLFLRQPEGRSIWKQWLLSQVAIALLSVIGLAGIFSGESGYWWGVLDTWHGAPTWRDLISLMLKFSLGSLISGRLAYMVTLAVFGSCAAWSLIRFRGARPGQVSSSPGETKPHPSPRAETLATRLQAMDEGLVFALMYLVIPVGAIFLVSQFRSFWVLRYLFAFLPPYCILVGRGIARMPGRVLPALLTTVIVLVSLWPISDMYRFRQKEDWRGAVQYIASQERPGDVLFMVDEDLWLPFEHYYQGAMNHAGISRSITDRDFLAARVGLAASSYKRIWLVLSHTDNALLKDYLLTSGDTDLVAEKHLVDVEVYLFTVNPPPASKGGTPATAGIAGGS